MKLPNTLKILFPAIIYAALMFGVYFYMGYIAIKYKLDLIYFGTFFGYFLPLLYIILPFLLIIELVRRRRKYIKNKSNSITFQAAMYPGIILGITFSYNFYIWSNGSFSVFLIWSLIFIPLLLLISGLLGILIDLIWNKMKK